MRPQSIIRFEQLYLASTAVIALGQFLNATGISGPSDLSGAGPVLGLVVVALSYGFVFLFWFLIARRASNVAKWILVVLTVLGLLGTVPLGLRLAETDKVYAVLTVLATVLQCASMAYLFRRDAVEWLRSRGQIGVVDVTTFN